MYKISTGKLFSVFVLLVLIFFSGCQRSWNPLSNTPSLLQNKSTSSPSLGTGEVFKDGIFFLSQNSKALHWRRDASFVDIIQNTQLDLFAVSPRPRELLVIDNVTSLGDSTISLWKDHASDVLLARLRQPIAYAVFSPIGSHLLIVTQQVTLDDTLRFPFELFLYSFQDARLLHLAESSAYPSWAEDGKRFVYTKFQDFDAGEGVTQHTEIISQSIIPDGTLTEPVALVSGMNSLLFHDKLFYVSRDDDGFDIYALQPVTGEIMPLSDLNLAGYPHPIFLLQLSEDRKNFAWSQLKSGDVFSLETWLVPFDVPSQFYEVIPQSESVLWYNNNTLVFRPVAAASFSSTLQLFDIAAKAQTVIPGSESVYSMMTPIGYQTDPSYFLQLVYALP